MVIGVSGDGAGLVVDMVAAVPVVLRLMTSRGTEGVRVPVGLQPRRGAAGC